MSHKLYVGNLSNSTGEDALWKLFSQAGTVVSVDLIRDRLTKRSKGYAFITMDNLIEAEKAIETFDGYRLDSNEIRVSSTGRREPESRLSDHAVALSKRSRNKKG